MKRSFAELDSARQKPEWEETIKEVKQKINKLESLNCLICITDLDDYYRVCSRLCDLEKSMRVSDMCSVKYLIATMCMVCIDDASGVTRVSQKAHSRQSGADKHVTVSFSTGCSVGASCC